MQTCCEWLLKNKKCQQEVVMSFMNWSFKTDLGSKTYIIIRPLHVITSYACYTYTYMSVYLPSCSIQGLSYTRAVLSPYLHLSSFIFSWYTFFAIITSLFSSFKVSILLSGKTILFCHLSNFFLPIFEELQNDINKIYEWSKTWEMEFNAQKKAMYWKWERVKWDPHGTKYYSNRKKR